MMFYLQGRTGEIKHLYRNFAFLNSRLMTENGGFFVCKTRHLTLAGGGKVCVFLLVVFLVFIFWKSLLRSQKLVVQQELGLRN